MPMNLVIQQQRKALGLTQEQVAAYLGVSTPAVNKWEKGATCPDLSLLPPLARLLQVDLNTLFCFQEDLSQQEIGRFSQEITEAIQQNGIKAGFERAERKIQEYPNCDPLLHTIAILLDGALLMSGLSADEKPKYEDKLITLYARSAKSEDEKIKNSSLYMLASKYLHRKEYKKAQELLDSLPERTAINKRLLQAEVYLQQNEMNKAAELMEYTLLGTVGELQITLTKLADMELAAGEKQTADRIAAVSQKAVELFDLWEYGSYISPVELALAEKNEGESIKQLSGLLAAVFLPWNMHHSPLYHRIAKGAAQASWERILPPLLAELEENPKYSFLRANKEFQSLITEYQSKCK